MLSVAQLNRDCKWEADDVPDSSMRFPSAAQPRWRHQNTLRGGAVRLMYSFSLCLKSDVSSETRSGESAAPCWASVRQVP